MTRVKRALIRLAAGMWGWVTATKSREVALGVKVPDPGCVYNPLSAHRNITCVCGSGVKAKRCCGRFMAIPKATAEQIQRVLA